MTVARYDEDGVEFCDVTLDELEVAAAKQWIHVRGARDREALMRLGETFTLHPLILEDIVAGDQRAKVEDHDDVLFVVLWMVRDRGQRPRFEQLSLLLGENWVISLHAGQDDPFDPVRARFQRKARLRRLGSDYLAYALMDAVIDDYFPVIERIRDRVDDLEEQDVEAKHGADVLDETQILRRDLLAIRKHLRPFRDALGQLIRDEAGFIDGETRRYLRDAADHVAQLLEDIETQREILATIVDYHLTVQGQRMNEIMRTLTVIATLFMPMSFVAGLYGMNFSTDSPFNMPELSWRFGYFFALTLMLGTGVALLVTLRRRGFLR